MLSAAGLRPDFVAVGVDRLDYTKGIIERFRAVERMLETGETVFHQVLLARPPKSRE